MLDSGSCAFSRKASRVVPDKLSYDRPRLSLSPFFGITLETLPPSKSRSKASSSPLLYFCMFLSRIFIRRENMKGNEYSSYIELAVVRLEIVYSLLRVSIVHDGVLRERTPSWCCYSRSKFECVVQISAKCVSTVFAFGKLMENKKKKT